MKRPSLIRFANLKAATKAITFVNGNSAFSGANGGTISVTAPTGLASGDFLVALAGQYNGTTHTPPTAPAGWTTVISDVGTSVGFAVYTKTAGGSEPASYSFTSQTANQNEVLVSAWRGGTIFLETTGTLAHGAAATAVTASSITPGQIGTLLILSLEATGAATFTAPSGFTDAVTNSSNGPDMNFMYKTLASGASGAQVTDSSATAAWGAVLLNLANNT